MTIVARFFPNGEFSQGVDTSHKRRDSKCRHEECRHKKDTKSISAYLQWKKEYDSAGHQNPNDIPIGSKLRSLHHEYELAKKTPTETVLLFRDKTGKEHNISLRQNISRVIWEWKLVPLVYQMVESCDKPRSRKKMLSMSKRMSRNIRNAVYLLEQQEGGKDVLSFLTLTIPTLSSESLEKCCKNWDIMVKRFFDWLRVTLKRRNIQLQHVYCTEIQSKRLHSRNEYAPHLHVVFRGRNGKKQPWAVTPKQVRQAWGRCIASVVSEPFRTDALENIQRIKRSAARYLSKYLSKGVSIATDNPDTTHVAALSTQWGGMARTLSKALRQATTRLDSSGRFREVLSFFVSNLDRIHKAGIISYFKRGFISLHKSELDGAEYGLHVSCGCLSTATYKGGVAVLIAFIERELES